MILYFQTVINIPTCDLEIIKMISRTLIIAYVILLTYSAQACSFNLSAFEAFFHTGGLGIVVLHVMVP
jgi:hypothetical protein